MEFNTPNSALLRACRELVTKRMRATVARVVDDAALALERQTVGGSLSSPGAESFDAVRELRQRRREFAVCFEHRFHELFDRRLRCQPDAFTAGTDPVLVSCRAVLMEIDRRLETLLQRRRTPLPPNPMEPGIVIAAFNAACTDIGAGEPARRALMELFRRQVDSDLPRVYGEVNALLARQGIQATRPARAENPDVSDPFSTFSGRRPEPRSPATIFMLPDGRDPAIQRLVETLISGHVVPHFVQNFARQTWSRVLAGVKMENGEGSVDWDRALTTLEEIITSVEMFGDPSSRRVAIWKLPGLVRHLKTGMRSVRIPQEDQVLFLKTLRAHHLRVLGQRPAVSSQFPAVDPDENKERE